MGSALYRGYVILTPHDSTSRRMGEIMLGYSRNLKFTCKIFDVLVVDETFHTYTVLRPYLKTAGFIDASEDDKKKLIDHFQEKQVYGLNPHQNITFSFNFIKEE